MKKGIGPRALGSPLKQTKAKKTDKGFYVTVSGKKSKGEMGAGFYVGADGERSKTPASTGKIIKKVVKRKVQKPITALKPKPIPKIVK